MSTRTVITYTSDSDDSDDSAPIFGRAPQRSSVQYSQADSQVNSQANSTHYTISQDGIADAGSGNQNVLYLQHQAHGSPSRPPPLPTIANQLADQLGATADQLVDQLGATQSNTSRALGRARNDDPKAWEDMPPRTVRRHMIASQERDSMDITTTTTMKPSRANGPTRSTLHFKSDPQLHERLASTGRYPSDGSRRKDKRLQHTASQDIYDTPGLSQSTTQPLKRYKDIARVVNSNVGPAFSSETRADTNSVYYMNDLDAPGRRTNATLCGTRCVEAQIHLQEQSEKIRQLELELSELRNHGKVEEKATMDARRVQIFHRLDSDNSAVFLSPPVWNQHDGALQLKFSHFIQDPQRYVEKAGDVAYIVYKEYNVDHQRKAVDEQIKANVALPPPEPSEYHVQLVFRDTVSAMTTFLDSLPTFRADFPGFDESDLMHGPFTWWFHCRKSYDLTLIGPYQARLVSQLINTIEEIYGELYDRVIDQFAEGKVSQWSLEYLVRPGTVLLRRVGPLTLGCLAIGCTLSVQEKDNTASLSVDTRSIVFDGLFRRNFERHVIDIPNDGEVDIKSLKLFPLDFAEPGTRERLSRRGRTYWKCRQQRFVSCQEQSDSQEGERFMVDFETYKELHPDNSYTKTIFLPGKNYYKDSSLPDNDCDPEEPDIFLFPAVIPGFDFRRKKWKEIEVDKIRDVVWNDEAFSHLVADEDMKELIEALVSKQLAAETSTDLIKNKGNGLIMLLHGSPGTGKTFTAESVAELARKPLYPVTCGDIGTEPEKVENYLESIFHLGKKWNCVMLLDEAEVFLEQRTLQDLHRNALVSVFLRALEYYDGILILTTNRVGTFDEAFKSRIQISLPYKKLDRAQRKQIWRNFLGRLQGLGQHGTIDFDDIEAHLDDLADYSMNGRQIRNAITTARQLAEFRNKKMNFASLKKTIGVSEKFDKYLADVREGDVRELLGDGKEGRHSDDIIARENELR